jgi:hypothetical protein
MRTKKETRKSAKSETATGKAVTGFTDEERLAMKERAQELKAEARRGRAAPCHCQSQSAGPLAEDLVRDASVCQGRQCRLLLQSARKFKARYAAFGFSGMANLDDGSMWPVAFALNELTAAGEARIGALVSRWSFRSAQQEIGPSASRPVSIGSCVGQTSRPKWKHEIRLARTSIALERWAFLAFMESPRD